MPHVFVPVQHLRSDSDTAGIGGAEEREKSVVWKWLPSSSFASVRVLEIGSLEFQKRYMSTACSSLMTRLCWIRKGR